jgi:hypothetical protein
MINYKNKYFKYKLKYLQLKGAGPENNDKTTKPDIEIRNGIKYLQINPRWERRLTQADEKLMKNPEDLEVILKYIRINPTGYAEQLLNIEKVEEVKKYGDDKKDLLYNLRSSPEIEHTSFIREFVQTYGKEQTLIVLEQRYGIDKAERFLEKV